MLAALLLAAAAQADPLQATFTAVHRDYMAQLVDKFAEVTADPSVIGKPFKIVWPIKDGQAYSGLPGDAYYTYDDGKLRLIFIPDEKYAGPGLIEGPKYLVGIVGGSRRTERSYVGSNAFGVTARVQVVRLLEDGIAMLARPEGEENPYRSTIMKDTLPNVAQLLPHPPKNSYWLEMALPGPQARKVATDAALVVEGTIEPLEGGKLSICKGTYIEPKIDTAMEIYGSQCWVGANVYRIAFVRKSTGEVLKEWVR